MRTALVVLVGAVVMGGCGNSDPPLATYPDVSSLYDLSGPTPSCPTAESIDVQDTFAVCEWSCIDSPDPSDGRFIRHLKVEFERATTADAWRVKWNTFDFEMAECAGH